MAPVIMRRPLGISITAILMAANVACDIALSLTSTLMRSHNPAGSSQGMMLFHYVLYGLVVAQLLLVFFYWLGKSWARWAVLAGSLYYLMGLRTIVSQWQHRHATAELTVAASCLAVFLLWYLHTRTVLQWFAQSSSKS